MENASKLLSINKLSKTYPNGVKAMDGITLEISKGLFGLLGPNGAGKSTLLRTLATLQDPDDGSVHFMGTDVIQNPRFLRERLGYLPQDFGVYPNMSADSLLDYLAKLKGLRVYEERCAVIERMLDITNLKEHRHQAVSGYSGGMKQRFGIAQCLLNDPDLIIVDEPLAGLDPSERNRFLQVIRRVAMDNVVIFSTHIVDDVKDLCDTIGIMNQGAMVAIDSPKDLMKKLIGKVWSKEMNVQEWRSSDKQLKVLGSAYTGKDDILVRAYSDLEAPGDGWILCKPNIEDAYFHALSTAK